MNDDSPCTFNTLLFDVTHIGFEHQNCVSLLLVLFFLNSPMCIAQRTCYAFCVFSSLSSFVHSTASWTMHTLKLITMHEHVAFLMLQTLLFSAYILAAAAVAFVVVANLRAH